MEDAPVPKEVVNYFTSCQIYFICIYQSNNTMKLRKPVKQLYYRRRHHALTAGRASKAKYVKKMMLLFLIKMKSCEKQDEERHTILRGYFNMCVAYYVHLLREPEYILEAPVRRDIRIAAFTPSECRINFRFCQPDLIRLYTALHFPAWISFDNRAKMAGEEVFLRGMYELVTGENQHRSCTNILGREGTTQSRAFAAFINHF